MEPVEHDAVTSRHYKEDFDGLLVETKKTEAKLAKAKELLRIIAYPRRGTDEEDMIYAEDAALWRDLVLLHPMDLMTCFAGAGSSAVLLEKLAYFIETKRKGSNNVP